MKPPAKPKVSMFDLEPAIANWRRQMLAAGIKTPVPLEELELHLREEIERQIKSGLDGPRAFEISVARIGEAVLIGTEFKKISTPEKIMIRIVAMLAAIFGTVLGGAMVLPALGLWRDRGILHAEPLFTGCALAAIAGCAVIYGVARYRETRGRKLVTLFLVLAGSFYVVPLVQAFLFHKADLAGWIFCATLAAASVLFYGSCLRRIWSFNSPPTSKSR